MNLPVDMGFFSGIAPQPKPSPGLPENLRVA
jgi:hypothetical protein